MDDTLDPALKEAYALAKVEEIVLETLEVSHPSLETPVRLVKARKNYNLTLETEATVLFKACWFELGKASVNEEGIGELAIRIDNPRRIISDWLKQARSIAGVITITNRPYLESDTSAPQQNPPAVYTLKGASIEGTMVVCKASFADIVNKKAPSESFTRERFPSLANA
jgi:hypothetical protein